MDSLNYIEPDKIMAKTLLVDIENWENQKRKKLLQKFPNLSSEELETKVDNASSRKFKPQFKKIIMFKLYNLLK